MVFLAGRITGRLQSPGHSRIGLLQDHPDKRLVRTDFKALNRENELFLLCRFLIVVDEPALVDALPVLGEELPIRAGLHRCMVFLPANETFHQSRLFIDQLSCYLFLVHHRMFPVIWQI